MISNIINNKSKFIMYTSICIILLTLLHFFFLHTNANVPSYQTGFAYLSWGISANKQLVIDYMLPRTIAQVITVTPCILLVSSSKFRNEQKFFLATAIISVIGAFYTYTTVNNGFLKINYNFVLILIILLTLSNIIVYFSDKIQEKLS